MQICCQGDNLHESSNHIFFENKENNFKMASAEIFNSQHENMLL